MLRELACVELVHVPKELCLSCLKLITQRDYLIQSALITTKCFHLVYTETELENQKLSRSRIGSALKKNVEVKLA